MQIKRIEKNKHKRVIEKNDKLRNKIQKIAKKNN